MLVMALFLVSLPLSADCLGQSDNMDFYPCFSATKINNGEEVTFTTESETLAELYSVVPIQNVEFLCSDIGTFKCLMLNNGDKYYTKSQSVVYSRKQKHPKDIPKFFDNTIYT
jgi:hypothetical protein